MGTFHHTSDKIQQGAQTCKERNAWAPENKERMLCQVSAAASAPLLLPPPVRSITLAPSTVSAHQRERVETRFSATPAFDRHSCKNQHRKILEVSRSSWKHPARCVCNDAPQASVGFSSDKCRSLFLFVGFGSRCWFGWLIVKDGSALFLFSSAVRAVYEGICGVYSLNFYLKRHENMELDRQILL